MNILLGIPGGEAADHLPKGSTATLLLESFLSVALVQEISTEQQHFLPGTETEGSHAHRMKLNEVAPSPALRE